MQPALHYPNELLVAQLVIMVHIKDLEDSVHKVSCQLQASGHIDRTCKLICENQTSLPTTVSGVNGLYEWLKCLPCPIGRFA